MKILEWFFVFSALFGLVWFWTFWLKYEQRTRYSQVEEHKNLYGGLYLRIGTLGKQEIRISINGVVIGSKKVNSWDTEIHFTFEPGILNKDKVNIIQFQFPDAHKSSNGDNRVLAMALKEFQLK